MCVCVFACIVFCFVTVSLFKPLKRATLDVGKKMSSVVVPLSLSVSLSLCFPTSVWRDTFDNFALVSNDSPRPQKKKKEKKRKKSEPHVGYVPVVVLQGSVPDVHQCLGGRLWRRHRVQTVPRRPAEDRRRGGLASSGHHQQRADDQQFVTNHHTAAVAQ